MVQDNSDDAWLSQQGDLYVRQWSRAMMWSLAGIVLVCYDYALTLRREVQYIWGRRLTGALFVFYTVRYCGIISPLLLAYNSIAFPNVFAFNHAGYATCISLIGGILFFTTGREYSLHFDKSSHLTELLVFSVLRAYAVSGKKVWVRGLVVILGILEPAVSVVVVIYVTTHKANLESTWIFYKDSASRILIERGCAIARDALIEVITLIHIWPISSTVRQARLRATSAQPKGSLPDVIIKNGILYFGALLCLNIVAMALSRSYPDPLVTPVTLWLTVLTSILTSRFILDLQEANQSLSGYDTSTYSTPDDSAPSPIPRRRWRAKPAASSEMEFRVDLGTQNANADEEASPISTPGRKKREERPARYHSSSSFKRVLDPGLECAIDSRLALRTGIGLFMSSDPFILQSASAPSHHDQIPDSTLAVMLSLAGIVVGCYDYILTLDRELRYIWGRPLSASRVIFHIVRICGVANGILPTYAMFKVDDLEGTKWVTDNVVQSSSMQYVVLGVYLIVSIAAVVFSGLRAYAVSSRNVWVLAAVLLLGIVYPAIYTIINFILPKTYLIGWNNKAATSASYTLYEKLTTILTARFILDLQEAHEMLSSGANTTTDLTYRTPRDEQTELLVFERIGGYDAETSLV
ncbi:hypothetical protein C8Q79DRAFT_1013371 [Trametes meyenii]|nr:hypothetical protein C8Q79DRAFT_1013371 [Trametes meyenii]